MSEKEITVGDWIRYQQLGQLVIGVVEYVIKQNDAYPYKPKAITNIGTVGFESVIEVRKKESV